MALEPGVKGNPAGAGEEDGAGVGRPEFITDVDGSDDCESDGGRL